MIHLQPHANQTKIFQQKRAHVRIRWTKRTKKKTEQKPNVPPGLGVSLSIYRKNYCKLEQSVFTYMNAYKICSADSMACLCFIQTWRNYTYFLRSFNPLQEIEFTYDTCLLSCCSHLSFTHLLLVIFSIFLFFFIDLAAVRRPNNSKELNFLWSILAYMQKSIG